MNKIELLNKANQSYREGNPIMGDAEYDALEQELGLENRNSVGEKHSPELTVKHPFIMGSLSKVQVHRDKSGTINWMSILKQIRSYIGSNEVIITPKYDGCSFEAVIDNGKVLSISSRGDGIWGRDIRNFVISHIPDVYINKSHCTLRGEILIKKSLFEKKYADRYVNTRAFVAGVTGTDWDDDMKEVADDLSIVIYDYRVNDGDWKEYCWTELPKTDVLPAFYIKQQIGLSSELEDIYNRFDDYRKKCEYALDGFVIKPVNRVGDFTNARPKDCVAVKFLPITAETTVNSITWELGKTGEYFPIVHYDEVKLDGKVCVKASGHNYGTLYDRGIAPGSKIVISMAGDIIPYIYKVTTPVAGSILSLNIPHNTYLDGCHLMKHMSDEERRIEEFRNSCITLNVPGLGESQINRLIECLKTECQPDEFFDDAGKEFPFSIFELYPSAIERHIGGKNGHKIAKAYQDILSTISLSTIIETLNFRFCGKQLSKAIVEYLTTGDKNFESMATEGWKWATDTESDNYKKLTAVLKFVGKDIHYYSTIAAETAEAEKIQKTYVILTGEPANYDSKADFLNAHPEYEETSSWKKVNIVFTNSMESNTGKMKKAREKNIEIRTY